MADGNQKLPQREAGVFKKIVVSHFFVTPIHDFPRDAPLGNVKPYGVLQIERKSTRRPFFPRFSPCSVATSASNTKTG